MIRRNFIKDYTNKYGFIGKGKDIESGLNYVEARYYDSPLGRFISQDPVFWEIGQTKRGTEIISDPQQLNSYSYSRNNPITYSDPSGEFIGAIVAGIFIAGGIIATAYTANYFHSQMMNQISKGDQEGAKKSANLMLATPGISFAVDMVVGLAIGKFFSKALKSINWSKVSKPLNAIDEKLQSIIERNYRNGAEIGNGSTADAIRRTKRTGEPVGGSDHIQKGTDSINSLVKLIKSGKLNKNDTSIANNIINDLKNALKGK